MPPLVLTLAKLGFLAVLYVFLAWALRLAVREIRDTTEPTGAAPERVTTRPPELEVIEPREHKGTRIPLAHDMTIGRGENCNLQLDDGYVSTVHAVVAARGDDFFVTDNGSTNGTYVNRRRITEPTLIRRGDTVQIGRTVMEVTK